jgi:hypothetical protein
MTVNDTLQTFETCKLAIPVQEMQWALDHWDEAAPACLVRLEAYVDGTDRSNPNADALFVILHLCGEKRETRAFPALTRLLRDEAALERVFGTDMLILTLPGIMVSCFDGDVTGLQAAVEDANAESITRGTALLVIAYFVREGRVPHDQMRAYLAHLRETLQPQAEDWVWWGWVAAVGALTYTDLLLQVEALFNDDFIPPEAMDLLDFQESLRRNLDDPERMAMFEEDNVVPLEDAIACLTIWEETPRYTDDDDPDETEDKRWDTEALPADFTVSTEPRVNPFRNVGRNDLCPCGSGKKYKKCCLVAA